MPPTQGPLGELPTEAVAEFEANLRRFEEAWRRGGTPPVLDAFLPALPGERRPVLVELAHIDLEWRLKSGQEAHVEEYFARYPELAEDAVVAVALIVREHDLRRRRQPGLARDEYVRRFPRFRDELMARLPAPATNPIDSVESLSALLRRGPLLEPTQADQLATIQGQFREPRDLARELMRRNWLTPFQINHLFQGRDSELTLGPYLLLERLGQGGMGQVFKARHLLMKRVVALKLIRKDRLLDEEMTKRFQREVRAAAQLNHPNIVIAHDAACIGGSHFLVMEYVEGTDLGRLLHKKGPLSVAQACDYVRQAALGLQHAHEKGLVHRDVKPSNLIVTPEGQVKVLDMGLAR